MGGGVGGGLVLWCCGGGVGRVGWWGLRGRDIQVLASLAVNQSNHDSEATSHLPSLQDSKKEPMQMGGALDIQKWQVQSHNLRSSLQVSKGWKRWTGRVGFKGEGLPLTPRIMDLLNVAVAWRLRKHGLSSNVSDEVMLGFMQHAFADASQNHVRIPWTKGKNKSNEAAPCFTTSTSMYSFGHDRIVHAQEMARMMGWTDDSEIPASVSVHKYKQMLGSSIALPCLGAIMWTYYMVKEGLGMPAEDRA